MKRNDVQRDTFILLQHGAFMKRILFVIPLPYGHDWGFWTRDAGLMVLTLREMGYDAWLIALGDAATVTEDKPVLAVSLDDLNRPEWWKAQRPDAVVLYTGSAPRHDRMRQAALTATPRVVERLDTDGARSARLFPKLYYMRFWVRISEILPPYARWLAPFPAAARTGLIYLFPMLMDIRMVRTMKRLPAVIAESPVAAARIQQMFEKFSGAKHRVAMISHPVNEKVIRYDATPKENQIITVGRWASVQKDFPLLRKVLKGFLQRHPDWRATVVGSGVPARDRVPGNAAEEWQRRMTFHENLTHEKIVEEYNRSKIYVMVSRCEGFSVAASEALCCGCSVVSARVLASSTYTAEPQSGGIAETRTSGAFLDTLDREVECWTKGERNPKAIASVWSGRLGSHAVAQATLALLEDILPGAAPFK